MEGAVLIMMIGAAVGLGLSLVAMGLWNGAALLFGFPQPTGNQLNGLLLLLTCGGAGGLPLLAGAIMLWDELRPLKRQN